MFGSLKQLSSRVKILLIGFILILLPIAIISFMSFMSLNQKAENLEAKYAGTIRLVRDKLETEITQLESNLRNDFIDLVSDPEKRQDLKSWLRQIEKANPIYYQLVLTNQEKGLLSSELSLNWFVQNPSGLASPEVQEIVSEAEKAEFIRKNMTEAISLYEKALKSSNSSSDRAILFSRTGRCLYKLGSYKQGISEYKKILDMPGKEIKIGRIPAKAIAFSQIVFAFDTLEIIPDFNRYVIDQYEFIVDHPWDLSGGEFLFYLNTAKAQVQTLKDLDSITKTRIKIIDERAGKLLENIHFLGQIERNIFPEPGVIVLPAALQQLELNSLVYKLDREYILSDLFPEILDSVELGKDVFVGILSNNDSILFSQHNILKVSYLAKENFNLLFDGWKVALFDQDGKTIEQLIGKEKLLYLLLFTGIIVVALIGIVVLVRAVNQEARVMKMKSEFVSNVSHELKTPLALIRMFGETLESGIVTDEEKQKEFYSIIRKESERLTHLVNNVLDFTRMDTGDKKYNFTETNIVDIVKSSVEAYKFHIQDKGFEIESEYPDYPIELMVDRDSISQALLNLLSNAVKYSEDIKSIKVKVYKDQNSACISVADKGIGIPQDELNRIFDKFYQVAPGKSKEVRGSGLGLTITKQIIEAHNGQIEVHSQPKGGCTFIIIIPLTKKNNPK